MLEVTILRDKAGARQASSFKFENDELQAFFDALTVDDAVQLVSLRSLTSPLVLTGEPPKPSAGFARGAGEAVAAKTAGPGAPRTQAPGISTPIQEQARMSQTEIDSNKSYAAAAEAKARDAKQAPNVGPGSIRGAVPTKAGKPETK